MFDGFFPTCFPRWLGFFHLTLTWKTLQVEVEDLEVAPEDHEDQVMTKAPWPFDPLVWSHLTDLTF